MWRDQMNRIKETLFQLFTEDCDEERSKQEMQQALVNLDYAIVRLQETTRTRDRRARSA